MQFQLIKTAKEQRYHRLANKGGDSHEFSAPSWTGAGSNGNHGWVGAFQWETQTFLNLGESPSNSLFRPMINPLWLKLLSFCRRQRGRERTEVDASMIHFPELMIISVHFTSNNQTKNIYSLVKMKSGAVYWCGTKWGSIRHLTRTDEWKWRLLGSGMNELVVHGHQMLFPFLHSGVTKDCIPGLLWS